MSSYIDYETVHGDAEELHKFITEDLEVKGIDEIVLLLNYLRDNLQPRKPEQADAPENLDYVG